MTDLNSRAAAAIVVAAAQRVADRQIDRRLQRVHYGIVFAPPDRTTRKVAVRLMGQNEPSAGFVYGSVEPKEGDLVRAVIDAKGDRYIDDVLGRDLGLAVVDVLPAASVQLRGVILLLAGATGVADVVYICRKDATDVYGWAAL